MSRELKKVAPYFNWPLNQVWKGYLIPESICPKKCIHCDGSGYNEQTQEIANTFYDHEGFGVTWSYEYNVAPDGSPATRPPWKINGHSKSWQSKITQDEVQALVDKGRLMNFTHVFSQGNGWERRLDNYIPTAEEVNHWNENGMGHDGINRWILIETRAKRLGLYGHCPYCQGEGSIYQNEEQRKEYDEWKKTEPPSGDWWQVWETVSEGSPVTPAFATKAELVDYLTEYGDRQSKCSAWSRESAMKFVKMKYMPSMLISNGMILQGAKDLDQIEEN